MASKLIGTAVVFAMDGRTVAFSGVTTAQNEPTSTSLRDQFDKVDIKGKDGRTVSRGAANRRQTITVDILFKDDSVTPTRAQADAITKLPAMFGTVTLGGFNNTLIDGDWNYEEGTIADSNTAERKATFTLARMEKADGSMGSMTAVS
jgi:hypothetical protein